MNASSLIITVAGGLLLAGTTTTLEAGGGGSCQSSRQAEVALGAVGGGSQCQSSRQAEVALAAVGDDVQDIVDTAVEAGSFKTLAAVLQAADLVGALKSDGPFTVFAPTDDAFAKLPSGTVEDLIKPENRGLLTAILTYHVVPGRVMAADVVNLTRATTLNGQMIDVSLGKGVRIDSANVIKTDIKCTNGVIHVIDSVIMPSTDNIIETAVKAGSFETLAAAVKAAGLAATLTGEGPFTVFAPTDAAFAKLPAGTVESLLEPANRHKLADILKYHVVPGRVYGADALQAQTAETAQGSRVRFRLGGNGFMINGATIIQPDIETSNGVIHVIDEVILPG